MAWSHPEFDPEFGAGYTQGDVNRCARIVDEFLAAMNSIPKE